MRGAGDTTVSSGGVPPAPKPVAKYKTALLVGNLLYVSGHGPVKMDGKNIVLGKVGAELLPSTREILLSNQ